MGVRHKAQHWKIMLQCDSPVCISNEAWNQAGSSFPFWRLQPLTGPPHVCLGPWEPTEPELKPLCPKQKSDSPYTLWRSELGLVHSASLRGTGHCEYHRQKDQVDISRESTILGLKLVSIFNYGFICPYFVFNLSQKVKNVKLTVHTTKQILMYNDKKHRKAANHHISETGNSISFTFNPCMVRSLFQNQIRKNKQKKLLAPLDYVMPKIYELMVKYYSEQPWHMTVFQIWSEHHQNRNYSK